MSLVSAYPCLAPSARLDRIRLAGPDDLPRVSSAPASSAGDGLAGRSEELMTGIIYRLTIDRETEPAQVPAPAPRRFPAPGTAGGWSGSSARAGRASATVPRRWRSAP